MSAHDNGGPAFPYNFPPDNPFGGEGMSLRDWFAGHVLAEMGTWCPAMERDGRPFYPNARSAEWHKVRAAYAYAAADAMLAERAKAEGQS